MSIAPAFGVRNPFPGLRPFREDEQNLFFGREALVDRMVDKLAAHRFLAVVGGSGSGKSSLVNCGLKPALRRGLLTSAGSSWRMVQIRPGTNPNHTLACALVDDGSIIPSIGGSTMGPDLVEATLGLSGFGLVDIYKQSTLGPDTNLLVVVDQFEELFRYRSLSSGASYGYGPETIRFVQLLLDAAGHSEVSIYIVVTMRSDFLGDCAQFDGLPEAISEGQYLVPRLTRAERRAAIEGPIHVVNCEISTALLTRLVNDVGDNPDQLSILQHAMNRTWDHWHHACDAQGPVTMEDYDAVGTMAKALDGHANKAYKELSPGRQQFLCQRVFKALTDRGSDPRGIRRPTKFANLCEIVGATPHELPEVLRPFRKTSRSFLLPAETDTIGPDSVIDISHESLMRIWMKLNVWTNEEAEAAREYRRLSESAERHNLKRSELMQDRELQTALDFEARQQPTAAWAELYGGKFQMALQFLRESQEHRIMEKADRELERRWQRLWQPIIVGVAVLGFFLVLFWNSDALLPKSGGNMPQSSDNVPQSTGKAAQELSAETKAMGRQIVIDIAHPESMEQHKLVGKQKLEKLKGDVVTYLPRVGGVAAGFGLLGFVTILGGRKLHRKLALPAIVDAIRNPVEVQPASQQQVGDPAAAAGTTYGAWWRRGLAFLLDSLVGFLLLGATLAPAVFLSDKFSDALIPAGYSAWVLLWCIYHVMTEASRMQASLGMWLVRTYLTDLNAQRLSRWGVMKRQLIKVPVLIILLAIISVPSYLFLVTKYEATYSERRRQAALYRAEEAAAAHREEEAAAAHREEEAAAAAQREEEAAAAARTARMLVLYLVVPLLMLGLYFLAMRRFRNKPIFRRRQSLIDFFSKTVVLVGRPAKANPVAPSQPRSVAAA